MSNGQLPHQRARLGLPSPYSVPPADSALRTRRVLALFGLLTCALAAAWFARVDWPLPAAILALLALVAVADLVVIQRRLRRTRRRGRG